MNGSLALLPIALFSMAASDGRGARPADELIGRWGGDHIKLAVTQEGGRLSLECGEGSFPLPARIGRSGNFAVTGRLQRYRPGPGAADAPAAAMAVSVRGQVSGDNLRLTLFDGKTGIRDRYELMRNDRRKLVRCL